MLPENVIKLANQPLDEEKTGLGQNYCLPCAKYFQTKAAMATHLKLKEHKKRVKKTKDIPYTQEEADRAAGL